MKKRLLTLTVLALVSAHSVANNDPQPQVPFIDVINSKRIAPTDANNVSQSNADLLQQVDMLRQQSAQREAEERMAQEMYNQNVMSQQVQTPGSKFLQDAIAMYKPSMSLEMDTKGAIVIPIGQGLLNTISTNFKELRVKTSDRTSVIESDGGTLYVSPTTSNPVGLVLYDAGVPESKISVTLVPIDAPPVIVDLKVAVTKAMVAKSDKYLRDLELEAAQAKAQTEQVSRSDQHTQRIIDILTPIAQGDLPAGFTLTNQIPQDAIQPCRMAIPHRAGQRLLSSREYVDVIIAKNNTDRVYQVREEMCLGNDVIAVGIHKKSYLKPNEEVEIYILRDKFQNERATTEKRRPRLTLGE